MNPSIVLNIASTMNTFITTNPGKLCVVHCTHGYNRTGLVVCTYLHEYENMSLNEAVSLFRSQRSYVYSIVNVSTREFIDPRSLTSCNPSVMRSLVKKTEKYTVHISLSLSLLHTHRIHTDPLFLVYIAFFSPVVSSVASLAITPVEEGRRTSYGCILKQVLVSASRSARQDTSPREKGVLCIVVFPFHYVPSVTNALSRVAFALCSSSRPVTKESVPMGGVAGRRYAARAPPPSGRTSRPCRSCRGSSHAS